MFINIEPLRVHSIPDDLFISYSHWSRKQLPKKRQIVVTLPIRNGHPGSSPSTTRSTFRLYITASLITGRSSLAPPSSLSQHHDCTLLQFRADGTPVSAALHAGDVSRRLVHLVGELLAVPRVHLQADVVDLQLEGPADAGRRDAHARDAVLHQRALLVLDAALARQEKLGERDLQTRRACHRQQGNGELRRLMASIDQAQHARMLKHVKTRYICYHTQLLRTDITEESAIEINSAMATHL